MSVPNSEQQSTSSAAPPAPVDGGADAKRKSSGDESDEGWRAPQPEAVSWVQRQIENGASAMQFLQLLMPDMPPAACAHMSEQEMWSAIMHMMSDPPKRTKLDAHNTLEDAVTLIRDARKIVVLTGAGVSVSCGIPDFRSKNGVYARLHVDYPDLPDPQAMFDIDFFRSNPRPFFDFAKQIYPGQFAPSRSHRFIAALEQEGHLLRNYTQNIDTLEQVAGIRNLVQCHGSFSRATCCACGTSVDCDAIREEIFAQRIPRCTQCAADTPRNIMKPDIVFFGESLPPSFHRQMTEDKDVVDLLIIMGSSMKVRPVALIPDSIPAHVPQIVINNEPLAHLTADIELIGDCDHIVDELCRRLGGAFAHVCQDDKTSELVCKLESDIDYEVDWKYAKKVDKSEETTSADGDGGASSPKRARVDDTTTIEAPAVMYGPAAPRNIMDCVPDGTYVFQTPNRCIFYGAKCVKRMYGGEESDDGSSGSSSSDDSTDSDADSVCSLPIFVCRPIHMTHHHRRRANSL